MTPVITATTFTNPNEVFNLLTDSTLDIDLPVLTTTPNGCFSINWKVYRASDNVDMETTLPSNFAIDTGNGWLRVTHTLGDFTERLSLFSNGPETYYFEGIFDNDVAT